MEYFQTPDAAVLKAEPEDDAQPVGSAGRRHAVDITVLVQGQSRTRSRSIVAAGEGMNHALSPGAPDVCQLVCHSAATLTKAAATSHSGAIEIALAVERYAFVGFSAIRTTTEAVQDGVSPAISGKGQLEDCTRSKIAALHGRAVEIAGTVDD